MVIDARELKLEELFIKLRDILTSERGNDVFIEILLDTHDEAKKVKAFVSMSGCQTEIEEKEKEGYYIMRAKGYLCCV